MIIEQDNFILTYKNVYPEGYCQHLIDEFERLAQSGVGFNRKQSESTSRHIKDDFQINMNFGVHSVKNFENRPVTEVFFEGLQKCYDDYAERFSVILDQKITSTNMKMQRTLPGGGYHVWHGEQGNGVFSSRVLAFMLYLNTLPNESAGETEFLYQQRRFHPEENSMLIWPASFTHAHRGNTVFGEKNKYIVTGWFHYE